MVLGSPSRITGPPLGSVSPSLRAQSRAGNPRRGAYGLPRPGLWLHTPRHLIWGTRHRSRSVSCGALPWGGDAKSDGAGREHDHDRLMNALVLQVVEDRLFDCKGGPGAFKPAVGLLRREMEGHRAPPT